MKINNSKVNGLIETLEQKTKGYFKNDKRGHDMGHFWRTLDNALKIQSKEGGDIEVIAAAAFLHDVHRMMGAEQKIFIHPKQSIPIIKEFISDLPLSEKQKEHVCFSVEHHEEYNFGADRTSATDIETLIIQDADNLDAFGAIGIARSIQYHTAHEHPLYDSRIPLYQDANYTDSKNDETFIHHINNKMLRFGKHLNTKTARKMGKRKTKLCKEFLKQFIEDWKE